MRTVSLSSFLLKEELKSITSLNLRETWKDYLVLMYENSGTWRLDRRVSMNFWKMCLVLGKWGHLVSHSKKIWRRDCVSHPYALFKTIYWDFSWSRKLLVKMSFSGWQLRLTWLDTFDHVHFENILILKINTFLYIKVQLTEVL